MNTNINELLEEMKNNPALWERMTTDAIKKFEVKRHENNEFLKSDEFSFIFKRIVDSKEIIYSDVAQYFFAKDVSYIFDDRITLETLNKFINIVTDSDYGFHVDYTYDDSFTEIQGHFDHNGQTLEIFILVGQGSSITIRGLVK